MMKVVFWARIQHTPSLPPFRYVFYLSTVTLEAAASASHCAVLRPPTSMLALSANIESG